MRQQNRSRRRMQRRSCALMQALEARRFIAAVLLADLNTNTADGDTGATTTGVELNGVLYYYGYVANAVGGVAGDSLVRSDGTAQGTYALKDLLSTDGSFNNSDITPFNDELYFIVSDSMGRELWKSNGTVA